MAPSLLLIRLLYDHCVILDNTILYCVSKILKAIIIAFVVINYFVQVASYIAFYEVLSHFNLGKYEEIETSWADNKRLE